MKKYLAAQLVIMAFLSASALGQVEAPKFNFNIGGGVGFPQGDTGTFANTGGNFVAGAGLNMGPALGFNGEFMWHDLPPKSAVIAATGAPDGSARLYSFTGNLILHSPEAHKAGFYGIGGIGWYHRSWELTAPTLSIGTVCLPSYAFWGVVCSNGLVSSTAVLNSGSSDGFGWNIGGGLTFRLGESHAKVYAEARYHYAYHNGINTQVLPLTFGLRW